MTRSMVLLHLNMLLLLEKTNCLRPMEPTSLLLFHVYLSLSPAAFRGLDHDGEANRLCSRLSLFRSGDHGLVEHVLGDGALVGQLTGQAISTPGDAGHLGGLRQDVRCDLVTQCGHHT